MRLTQKILLIVSIFLIVQLVLFFQMATLQSEAERDLDEAIMAREFVDDVNAINEELYRFTREAHGAQSLTQIEVIDRATKGLNKIHGRIKSLKKFAALNEKINPAVKESEKAVTESLAIAERVREGLSTPGYVWEKSDRSRFRTTLQRMSTVSDVGMDAKVIMNEKFAQHIKLRSELKNMLLASLLLVAVGTLWLTIFLLRHIGSRLETIQSNFIRLAAGAPLNEPMPGTDELSELDANFHLMVKELEDANRKQHALLNKALSLICTIDRNGRFLNVNPASMQLLGFEPQDLVGSHYIDLISRDVERVRENLYGDVPSFEAAVRRKDGVIVDTLWSVVTDSDKNLLCAVHDISEQKEAERMRQDLVSLITFELQHPLRTITTFLNDLSAGRMGSQSEKGQDLLAMALRSSSRMSNLIGDLLDAEKIESGSIQLELKRVSIEKLLLSSVAPLRRWALDRGVDVAYAESDLQINADEERIGRVLTNLVSNAVKYSPKETKVYVDVSDAGDFVDISVTDEGRGIPAETLDGLFDRFKQASAEDRRSGTGLGLAICKDLVELHGGTLTATSVAGKGSVFRFTLPK